MSFSKKNTKKQNVENVDISEELKLCCRIINEVRSGLSYWGYDKAWPFNLYTKSLEHSVIILNRIIYNVTAT